MLEYHFNTFSQLMQQKSLASKQTTIEICPFHQLSETENGKLNSPSLSFFLDFRVEIWYHIVNKRGCFITRCNPVHRDKPVPNSWAGFPGFPGFPGLILRRTERALDSSRCRCKWNVILQIVKILQRVTLRQTWASWQAWPWKSCSCLLLKILKIVKILLEHPAGEKWC